MKVMGYSRYRFHAVTAGLAAALLIITGCAHYPTNEPLKRYDPDYGYRGKNVIPPEKKSDEMLLILSFSGGGTRAAAFSYGVLEALRKTEVTIGAKKGSLLDQVDAITGVSGGSFTAAYYGLFGDRIFEDFESKFLKANIQGALTSGILFNPINWARLFSPYFDRSDIAAEYYDEHVFDRATFGDMLKRKGPMIFINATDMALGNRMAFTQDAFDLICSDLSNFPVARACAASSAVPMVLTPISLKNYAGTCDYRMPKLLELAMEERALPDRRFDLANNMMPFLDSEKKPYIHLVDGGVADNLGLRAILERVIGTGDVWTTLKNAGSTGVHKIVFVVVNAETEISPRWSLLDSIPPFGAMLESYSSIGIARYNVETVALLRESFKGWEEEIRKGRCPVGQVSTEPGSCGDIKFYFVEVKFDALKNPEERSHFKQMPTSFVLKPEQVDGLRDAANRILKGSREFQRLLTDLD
jgi:NTE family protein